MTVIDGCDRWRTSIDEIVRCRVLKCFKYDGRGMALSYSEWNRQERAKHGGIAVNSCGHAEDCFAAVPVVSRSHVKLVAKYCRFVR